MTGRKKPRSSYSECRYCQVRLLLVKGLPPLEFTPAPDGKVAVSIDSPRRGRFLAKGEPPGRLEKTYRPHECDGMKRAAQRTRWRTARSANAARQRTARTQPAVAVPLPGMLRRPT